MSLLSQPTTDAGTIEIGEPFTEYFVAQAVRYIYKALLGSAASQEVDNLERELKRWNGEIEMMERLGRYTMRPSLNAELPMGVWRTVDESGTRKLQFIQGR